MSFDKVKKEKELPPSRLRSAKIFTFTEYLWTVSNYEYLLEEDSLFFDAPYQRGYVWSENEQQQFLSSLLKGFPVGTISLSRYPDWYERKTHWYEVVDGKQRLITLKLFLTNKIPLVLNEENLFWGQLNPVERRLFTSCRMPTIDLEKVNDLTRLQYFANVNFSGVPQSEEHSIKIMKMIKELTQ